MPSTRLYADRSNGYEAVASELMERRDRSSIGVEIVRTWAHSLAPGATILDLGCGHGVPISSTLMEDGYVVYGVDASPTLAAFFSKRFPGAPIACEPVEESDFFGRTFDAVIAIGLIFLLPEETQRAVLHRAAAALNHPGRFLFTAPAQVCTWTDILTGRRSISLGADTYKAELGRAGLVPIAEYEDEGENHYYDAATRMN